MSSQQYPSAGGYPGAAPPPNGATAITAGVLAVLGGLWHVVGLIVFVAFMGTARHVHPYVVVIFGVGAGVNLILVVLLVVGGIMLFVKKPAGRVLTIIGSGLAILLYFVSMVGALFVGVGLVGFRGSGSGAFVLIFVVPATATLVLAIVRPTAQWVGQGKPPMVVQPGYDQSMPYPPQQYPPQPYPPQQYPPQTPPSGYPPQ